MKKFMIFLLMTFLYLGTVQARSEASYPVNADVPSPCQVVPDVQSSFFAPAPAPGDSTYEISPVAASIGISDESGVTFTCTHFHNTYYWYVDDVPYATTTGNTCTVKSDSNFQLTVGVHQIKCAGESKTKWQFATLTVLPDFTVRVDGPNEVCADAPVTFTAVVEGEDAGHKVVWKVNNQYWPEHEGEVLYISRADSIFGYKADSMQYDVVAEVARTYGCERKTSAVHTLYIMPKPVATITGDSMICEGAGTTLTAHTSLNMEPLTWIWLKDGDTVASTSSNTLFVTEPGRYAVKAVYEPDACNSEPSEAINVQEFEIDIELLEFVDYPQRVCEGTMVEMQINDDNQVKLGLFTSNGETELKGVTYTWYQDGAVIPGVTGTKYRVNLEGVGTHTFNVVGTYDNYPCGTSKSGKPATITVVPAPTVVIATDPIVCDGQSDTNVTLAAHANPAGTNYVYTWYEDNVLIESDSTDTLKLHKDYREYAYNFSVVAEDTVTHCTATAEASVLVNDTPEVHITISDSLVCRGGVVMLAVQLDDWNTDNLTYQWYRKKGDGGSYRLVPGGTMPTLLDQLTNTDRESTDTFSYMIKVTQTTSGCVASSKPRSVRVIPNPELDIELLTPSVVCDGKQVILKAESKLSGNDYYDGLFVWTRNGVLIPGAVSPVLSENVSTPAGQATVYAYNAAVVLDHPGCVEIKTEPVIVVVEPAPTVAITGDALICDGNTVNLQAVVNDTNYSDDITDIMTQLGALGIETEVPTDIAAVVAAASGSANDFSYEWRLFNRTVAEGDTFTVPVDTYVVAGSGFNETELSLKDVPASDQPYIFTLNVTNGMGCDAVSDPFYVYVNDSIHVAVTVDYDTVCAGGQVVATAHIGDYNADHLTYQWYENGAEIAHATSPVYTTHITGNTELKVKVVQTNSGCSAEGEASVAVFEPSIESVVVVNDNEAATTLCEGAQIFVAASLKDAAGSPVDSSRYSYVWYENGILMPGVTGPAFSKQMHIIDDDMTTFVYTAYIDFGIPGCKSEPMTSDTVTVRRNPIVVIEGNHNVCYLGDKINNVFLTAWVDGKQNSEATYQWYKNGEDCNGAGNNNLIDAGVYSGNWPVTYNNPLIFTVEVTNGDGCSTISEPFEINVWSVPEFNISGDADAICQGGEVSLVGNLVNYNDEMLVYQWYKNNVNNLDKIPASTHIAETFVPTETTDYILEVKHLTAPKGDQCLYRDTFHVEVNPIPVIDTVTLTQTEVCEGAQIGITATPEGGYAEGEVYTWRRNGIIIDGATAHTLYDTPEIVDNNTQQFVYTAVVTRPESGCQSLPVASDTLTVYPNPTVVISGDQYVCEGQDVVLKANVDSMGAAVGMLHYTWYESGSVKTENVDSNTYKSGFEPQDEPYRFTVTVERDAVAAACTSTSAEYLVYVFAKPAVHVTATETEVCVGGVVTATANLDDYNAENITYQWYKNNVKIAGATERTFTETCDAERNDTLVAEVTQTTSLCTAYDTIVIKVNAIPVIAELTNDLGGNNTICDGRSVTMTATADGGVEGGEVYTWRRNGVIIEGAVQSVYTETPHAINNYPTDYVYSVSVRQTASGCESELVSDTVTVNPNPTLAIVYDPIVCTQDNDNVELVAHVYPEPATGYTFEWFEDNAVVGGATGVHNDTLRLTKPYRDYAYNFSVSLVNAYGCVSNAEATVLVNDTPVVNISSTETQICVGGQVTLTANLDDWNADELEFHWYEGGEMIPGATSLSYTVAPDEGEHEYTFSVKQLTSLCVATSNVVEVNVNAIPVITELTNDLGDNNTICDGRSVTMTATTVEKGVPGGEVYTWRRNGVIIEGAVQSVYTETPHAINNYPTDYVYSVSVRQSASGCESELVSDTVTVNPNPTLAIVYDPVVCGEGENNVELVAHVYPEPATGYTFEWFEDNAVVTGATGVHEDTLRLTKPYRDYAYNFSVSLVNDYGCVSNAEATVKVNAVPVVHVSSTDTTICVGGEITLTANLDDWNADELEFHWYDNDEKILGATSLSYTVAPAEGEHEYTFSVKQLTSLCETVSEAVVVKVQEDPVIASVTLSQYDVCEGAQIEITANIEGEDAVGDVYTWYRNGILMPDAHGKVIYDSPVTVDNNTQTFVYKAVLTRVMTGCQSLPVESDDLTVYDNPTVVISGDQYICETDTLFLIANVDEVAREVGLLHYTWYESGQVRDNMQDGLGDNQYFSEYFYAREEPYVFTVKVERDGVPAACASTSAPYYVYVYPQPVVNVTASETEICKDGEVTLTAHLNDYNASNITYQWYYAKDSTRTIRTGYGDDDFETINVHYNEIIPGATGSSYTTALAETSTLGVKVLQTMSECYDIDEVTVNVVEVPVVTSVTVDNDTVCSGAQVIFKAEVYAHGLDMADAVYTWYRNGVIISGATESTYREIVTTASNQTAVNEYNVTVRLPFAGCESSMADNAAKVTVNPAPSAVTISGNNIICENDSTKLTVYTDVANPQIIWSTNETTDSIYVESGVYTVTVKTPEGCEMTSEPFEVKSFGSDLIVSATETSICAGEHTTLSVDQNGWIGNVTYQWNTTPASAATTVDVAPDTTTTYKVTATVVSHSGSCTKEGEITIIVNALPTKPVASADDSTLCVGEQAVLHAEPDDAHAYIWYQNGIVMPGENQAVLTVNMDEAGFYAYAVKAVSTEGCISAEASEPVVITVNAAPESVVISGQLLICNGGYTTLHANVTPNVEASYKWYKDDAEIDAATSQSLIVNEAGSYKVEAATNGCTAVSEAVDVFVQQSPEVQLTATEMTVCVGGTTVITAEATGWNNDDVVYAWSDNTGNYVGSAYTFIPDNPGDYKFDVKASQATSGCESTDSITIRVLAVPEAPVIEVDNPTVCDGGQVKLTITNDYSQYVNPVFTWYRNGQVVDGATQASLTESPVGVDGDKTLYTYTASVASDLSGCTSAMSEDAVVTVVPTPVVAVTVDGNTTICEGGETELNAHVTPAFEDVYTYQWYEDNVLMEGETGATLTVTGIPARETAYNYTVVVSANPGCNVTSDPTAVTVVADPVVVATVDKNTVCAGGKVTFSVTVDGGVAGVNGLNGYTFEWYSNMSTDEPVATTPVYTTDGTESPDAVYSYWVVVSSPYGCETESNHVYYAVVADPVVTVEVAAGYPETVCDGGSTELVATVTGGHGTASYQWYKNGVILSGETAQTLTTGALAFGVPAAYKVVVTQTGVDCQGESEPFSVNVVEGYTVDIIGNTNTCPGGTVTLTATVNGLIDGDAVTYQWYKVSDGVSAPVNGATGSQYTTSPLNLDDSYDYYVVVTSAVSGCSAVSGTVTANVVPAPTVAISGAHSVCENGVLTLNAFVEGGVAGDDYSYTWSWTGAATGTATTSDPVYVPQLPANDPATPYYFTVTISRDDNTGCESVSAPFEVNVIAAPAVVVTADHPYVCEGGRLEFTANVTPAGSYDYAWTVNGESLAANSASVSYVADAAGTVGASVTVSATGADQACSTTATLAVPVNVVNDPAVTIVASHTAMCVGGSTTLSIVSNTGDNNIPSDYTYQWYLNGFAIEGADNETFTQNMNVAGLYNYTLKVVQNAALGCASSASAPVAIQVAEQPQVTVNSDYGLDICEGGEITLKAEAVNYGNTVNGVTNSDIYGDLTFDWRANGVSTHANTVSAGVDQITKTIDSVGNYDYMAVVTPSGYACQPAVSNSLRVSVVSDPSWTNVNVQRPDICIGDVVVLKAGIQGGVLDNSGNTNGQIQWTVTYGGITSNVSGGLGGQSEDLPAEAGEYIYAPTYTGNIGNGCTFTSNPETAVTVHPLPTATFTGGDGTVLCSNVSDQSAALTVTFTGTAPFTIEVQDMLTGKVKTHVSQADVYEFYETPTETNIYRIISLSDANCQNGVVNATATVFVNDIDLVGDGIYTSGCGEQDVTVEFTMNSGDPEGQFTAEYDNGEVYQGVLSNNTATFAAPSEPGDYNVTLNIGGCSYEATVRVLVGDGNFTDGTYPFVDQRWNDVVVVNNNPATNGGHTFVAFQWYKNGEPIAGATQSNYQDPEGLNGFYSVDLVEQDADGREVTYQTCDFYFMAASAVRIYPVPAHVQQMITVELDLTAEELDGAVLDIYDVTGSLIDHVTNLTPITKISGFHAQGTYYGRILTGTNEIKTVKFIIVK